MIASCNTTYDAVICGLNPVTFAAVTVGIPMDPNATGVVLATRQTVAAKIGSNPNPQRIPAGIATAVPNPAIPPPNPHAMISTRTRLSLDTEVSIFLISSIFFVCTTKL